MTRFRPIISQGLIFAGLLLSAGPALAAGSDDGFKTFWQQFIAAVGKGDQKAVSQMIKYPIYYSDAQRQIGDFPMIWKGSFRPAQRTCLAKQKPVSDVDGNGNANYSAFCGSVIYVFNKDGESWKLSDFSVND